MKYLAVRASVSTARPDVSNITTVTSKMPSKDDDGSDIGDNEVDGDSENFSHSEDHDRSAGSSKCILSSVQCKSKHQMVVVTGGVHRDYDSSAGVGCDYCHSGYTLQNEPIYYHCEECKNFDCCVRCGPEYMSKKFQGTVIRIPHHSCELALVKNPYEFRGHEGYLCNGCGQSGAGMVYHCQKCEYDVHPICAYYNLYDEQLPQTFVVSSHPHVLTITRDKASWKCDGRKLPYARDDCSTSHTDDIARYRCNECDYDHCIFCVSSYFISAS